MSNRYKSRVAGPMHKLAPIFIWRLTVNSLLSLLILLEGCDACNRWRERHAEQVDASKHYMPLVLDYPRDGVQLANGWNTNESHKTPGVCIDYATHDDTGQETFLNLKNVTDNSEMSHEFVLSASASYSAGIAGASAKYMYARSVEIKDDYDYFAAEAQVLNGAHYVVPRRYSEASAPSVRPGSFTASSVRARGSQIDLLPIYARMAEKDPAGFLQVCGDSFVSALHDGGEVTARLQFAVHSKKEKETIRGELNGAYGGATLSSTADNTLSTYEKSSQLKILYYKTGGSGDPVPVNKEGLLSAIKDLAQSAKSSPHPFVVTVERYETLPSWPKKARGNSYNNIHALYDQYAQLKTLFDIADYVKRNPGDFILNRGVTIQSMKDLQDRLQARLNSIKSRLDKCLGGDSTACQLVGDDATPDYAYRVSFPVRPNSFDEDRQLSQNQAALPGMRNELADLRNRCFAEMIGRRGQTNTCSVNGQISAKTNQIQVAEKAIADAQSNYAVSLRNAIAEQWIKFPASLRCEKDPHALNCISNAKQEEWSAKIVTQ